MSKDYENISELPRTQKWRRNIVGINEPGLTNKAKFHSPKNLTQIANTLFAVHIKNGGNKKSSYIVDLVIREVPPWLEDNNPDTYESLVAHDSESEIEVINNQFVSDFIEKHNNIFMKNPYTTITATHKFDMYDYRSLDGPQRKDVIVDTGKKTTHYRHRNTIPLYQKCNHNRHHEQDVSEGLRNRGSVETIDRGFGHNRISEIAGGDYSELKNYGIPKSDQYPY